MEDRHYSHLELTTEEREIFLNYIRQPSQPGRLDPAKFLKAASILFRNLSPQNILAPVLLEVTGNITRILVQDHDKSITDSAMYFLWTLLQLPEIKNTPRKVDTLSQVLARLQRSPSYKISSQARSLLWQLGGENSKDPDKCHLYALNCLQYSFFNECVDWCDQIIVDLQDTLHRQITLIRGKAYAHIHMHQMWKVVKNGLLDVAVAWKSGDLVDCCASNAKKAIGDLGFTLDHGILDEDGSYLLDLAMINHVLIRKQLKDCQRCLLCRRRGVKLKESHTIPKFLLKEMSNQTSKRLKEKGLNIDGVGILYNCRGKFRADTANTAMKYTLLCERCEQCLSQNGEDQFRKDFIPCIYNDSDEIQTVVYDSTLYSFCLGVLFRSFVNNGFFYFANADEVYSLLMACRQHLIQLPVKVTEKKEIEFPPPVAGIGHVKLPNVYIIINPYEFHVPNSTLQFLAASMSSSASALYLTTPLNKERETSGLLCHAVVVHMGVCNVIVSFSPARNAPLDEMFRIDPQGAMYPVLPELSRWSATPQGIFTALSEIATLSKRQYQQVASGMKSTKGDSRKVDNYVEKVSSTFPLETGPIDLTSLHTMPIPSEEIDFISEFLSKSELSVKLLPEQFNVTHIPPKVTLKEGYLLLYHVYDKDTNITYFFAANPDDILSGEIVVLVSVKEDTESYTRVEGVYLHIKIDGSVCVTGHLQESTTERLKEGQHTRLGIITERVMKAVNTLLQRCGTPNMFLLYASIRTRLQNRVSINHKCSSSGCWYCKKCCHICMEDANQGYTLFLSKGLSKGLIFKHCGEDCQTIIDKAPHFSVQIFPMLIHGYGEKYLVLLSSEGCFSSHLSPYTVMHVMVCVSIESVSIAQGKPFTIVQIRSKQQQVFFAAYLSDDFSLIEPVYDYPRQESFSCDLQESTFSQIVEKSLQNKGIFSVSQLIMTAIKADASIATYFCTTLGQSTKLYPEHTLEAANSRIYHEESFTRWIVAITHQDGHQVRLPTLDKHSTYFPLLPLSCTLDYLFWIYFQFTSALWKQVVIDCNTVNESLIKKLDHALQVTTVIYEQSPEDVQNGIIRNFSLSSDIFVMCRRVGDITCEGSSRRFEELSIRFLALINKLLMAPAYTLNKVMSFVSSNLFHHLELIVQYSLPSISDMSAMAHHLLLTLLLKLPQDSYINFQGNQYVSHLNGYIQLLINSPFTMLSLLAKAIAAHLQSFCPQMAHSSGVELTQQEAEIIPVILRHLYRDNLKRRYYSSVIYQTLLRLCCHPFNISLLVNCDVVNELQKLMESCTESGEEDIIASIVWKISSNGEICDRRDSNEVMDSQVNPDHKQYQPNTTLEINFVDAEGQGFHCILDALLKMIKEYIHLYLNCKQVQSTQTYTVCTAVQLLNKVYGIMDTKERPKWTKAFVSATTLKMFIVSISKYRKAWLSSLDGLHTVTSIESLLYTWASCSKETCQLLIGTGSLKTIADSFEWTSTLGTLDFFQHDTEILLNRVRIIFKCAMILPMQVACCLERSKLRPLINSSVVSIRVLTKSIFAFIAKYRKISKLFRYVCLQNEEVVFITSHLNDMLQFGTSSIFSNPEEVLCSLQSLTSYPSNKQHYVCPLFVDTLITCLSDKTVGRLALETLWNLSFDPTVALAIINHENAIHTLKTLVFRSQIAILPVSILWTLGQRRAFSAACCDYIRQCYISCKYEEAVKWSDYFLENVEASDSIALPVKCLKGKSIGQMYLTNQVKNIGNNDWALLGYDNNCGTFKSVNEKLTSDSQVDSKRLLRQLSLYDVQSWEDLCAQGLLAINLLGEVLDRNALDEESSELLDLLLIDYCKEAGETSKCKRCLLCRVEGDLVRTRLQPDENDSSTCNQNIFILQSYMYTNGLQTKLMFCQQCYSLLFQYCTSNLPFIIEAINPIKEKVVKYDKTLYTCMVGCVAQYLPLVITTYSSNWKEVHAAFNACRQILLCLDDSSSLATLPNMYLLINPECWHMLSTHSNDMQQLSPNVRSIVALIADQQSISSGGDPHKCTLFIFHGETFNIVLDFGSKSVFPSKYLINHTGGSYTIPSMRHRWEMCPHDLLHVFQNLVQADKYRGAFRSILNAEKVELVRPSGTSLPLVSYSAKFLLPCKPILSFLPKDFYVDMDNSNNIKSISVPDGHVILGHTYNSENDFTVILACASDFTTQEKQYYYIFVRKLLGYYVVEGVFLKGKLTMFLLGSSPLLFSMYPSLGIQEVELVRQLVSKKISLDMSSFMTSLFAIIIKYGHSDIIAVSNYVDAIRDIDVVVSVDTICVSEGCWYCKYRCHSCFRGCSIGYAHKTDTGKQVYHCSERCYYNYTADIADGTVIDTLVGKAVGRDCGTHLLFNATVNLHTRFSRNTLMSIQLCVTYNHSVIPTGVLYVYAIFCTTEDHFRPLAFLIDHNMCPIKGVWPGLQQDIVQGWRKNGLIKRALQPALESIECESLTMFLTTRFPCSAFSFMDTDQKIYSITHNGEKVYATSSKDKESDVMSPLDCIRSVQ